MYQLDFACGRTPLVLDECDPINIGLVALFLFNEGYGAPGRALYGKDASGSNFPAYPWAPAENQLGQALLLDGSNDQLTISLALTDLTIIFEMYWTGGGSYQSLFTIGDTGGLFHRNTGVLSWYSGGDHQTSSATPSSAWHRVAITISGGTVNAYRSGLFDSQLMTGYSGSHTFTRIGGDPSNECFGGRLRNYRVYNRALPADQIFRLWLDPQAGLKPSAKNRWRFWWANTSSGASNFSQNVFASCSPVASLVRSTGKLVNASVSPVASIVRSAGKIVSASTSPVATLVRQTGKTVAASCSAVASASGLKVILKSVDAVCSPVASLVRQTGKRVNASTSPSASLVRSIAKTVNASTAPIASIVKSTGKALSVSVVVIADMVRQTGGSFVIDFRYYFRPKRNRSGRGGRRNRG